MSKTGNTHMIGSFIAHAKAVFRTGPYLPITRLLAMNEAFVDSDPLWDSRWKLFRLLQTFDRFLYLCRRGPCLIK